MDASLVRSHVWVTAVVSCPVSRAASLHSAAVSSSVCCVRPTSVTVQPRLASLVATARPMPVPAPVTSALSPAMLVFMGSPSCMCRVAKIRLPRPIRLLVSTAGASVPCNVTNE